MTTQARSISRSAARLAAVQALYQQEMEGTPLPRLLKEFHDHRLGATIEDAQYHDAERDFFDDIMTGVDARRSDIDSAISERLAEGWTLERLDVAHAFYDKRESGFVNGILDAIAKEARPARAE